MDIARRWRVRRQRAAAALAAVIVAAAVLAGCGGPAASPVAATRPADSRDANLTAAIQRLMRQAAIPGVIVGVWQRGQPAYVRAFGVRDRATRQPMTTGLSMRIGSETKTFTVTALLQLVDQGRARLDDPVSRYLNGVPRGNSITLRDLADMRSGLFNYPADPSFQRALERDPRRQWQPRQLLSYAFRHPLLFKPGSRTFYSDTNTVLLGLVIEKVSGQPLPAFIEAHILRPEHLTHTIFPVGAGLPSPRAQGYTLQSATGRLTNSTNWNPSEAWAAGAMISRLADLHAWARIVAAGGLLTPATQRERERFPAAGLPGVRGGYGLGLFKVSGWIGHNGSIPGYQSLTVYLPPLKASMVVLLNTDVSYRGNDPSTLFGQAITRIISPQHVFYLPPIPAR